MSETSFRDRFAPQSVSIPYRATEGVRVSHGLKEKTGSQTHFVRARGGGLCQLGEEEYFIFTLLDGRPTFSEIEREFRARFARGLSRSQFQTLMDELLTAGIVEQAQGEAPVVEEEESAPPISRAAETPGGNRADRSEPDEDTVATGSVAAGRDGVSLLPLFLLLARLGSPLRYFVWLLVPAIAAAGMALFGGETRMVASLTALRSAPHWALSGAALDVLGVVLVVLLVPTLAKGAVAAFHGAPRETFRLRLSRGFLPQSPIDPAGIGDLSRKGGAWSHAAPILARLTMFVVGASLWASRGTGGDQLATAGLLLGELGLWSFLFSVMPLWPGDGRRWIAAYFNVPALDRGLSRARGGRGGADAVQDEASASDKARARGFLVCAVAISLLAFAGALVPWVGLVRGAAWSGIGAALLASAYAAALLWLCFARITTGRLRDVARAANGAYARTSPGGPSPFGRSAPPGRHMAGSGRPSLDERLFAGANAWPSNRGVIRGAIAIAIIIAIIFLPYPYKSGGPFTVLPYDRYTLPARVGGEVMDVLVREGEWVKEGQVVGTLSDWNEVHSLAVAQAELEQAVATLQTLLISPKPEEVEVARQQHEQALSRIPFSKADYERKLALLKTNDISVRQFQLALSTYQQDQAAVDVTKANYDFVRVGPTAAQIAAARAGVRRQAEQVSYWKDQLGRTRIRATAAGQVVTPDPQLMLGQTLQAGAAFVRLEDHRVAHVEVQVPETDIRDIHLGGEVQAKAWGYEHTIWHGKVVLIAPDAQPDKALAGNIVRVVAEIPNPDGLLRPNMTGNAKVETIDMPVWVSYTRALMRFLLVEIWYWIP